VQWIAIGIKRNDLKASLGKSPKEGFLRGAVIKQVVKTAMGCG
jgi:hypothetical protein